MKGRARGALSASLPSRLVLPSPAPLPWRAQAFPVLPMKYPGFGFDYAQVVLFH